MIITQKYRPSDFDDFLGNVGVVESLMSSLSEEKLGRALLFVGESGTGKTTMARIIASYLDCKDIREIDAAVNRGVDFIRKIRNEMVFKPMRGSVIVYIFDECHMLTGESGNALLKVMEEPPGHVYFLLCSTNPEKILPTIRTRCEAYEMRSLTAPLIRKLLTDVAEEENISLRKDVAQVIVDHCRGVPRVALNDLNKIRAVSSAEEAKEVLHDSVFGDEALEVIDFYKYLLFGKGADWVGVCKHLKAAFDKAQPESLRIGLFNYVGTCLFRAKSKNECGRYAEMLGHLDTFPLDYATARNNFVHIVYKVFSC